MIIEENNTNDVESQEQVDVIETTTNELVNSNKSKEYKIPNYLSDEILNIKAYTYDEINQLSDDMSTDNKIDDSMYDTDLSNVSEKQLVKGTVVALNEKEVIIDIGFKSEGIIDKNEFSSLPEIGEVIDVYLVVFEDRKGRLILSKQKADFHKRWAELRDAYENETVLKGTVIKIIKGGLVVDLGVVNAFLPGSQLDMKPVTNFEQYISNEYEFKIVKFNEFRQNVVISRKATLVPEMDDAKKELLENLDVGSTINGTVKNMTDFGAFIDLGGIDGLLHITDITWGRINHPSDKFTLGEDVTVKVIDYDKEKNRISLGLKQLTKDPWDNAVKSYEINSNVKGKIVNMMNYGAFVELEEGIEGLIHISEISWTKHIKHPSDIYKIGDIVEAIVLSLDAEAKKISLGVKQLEQNPWEEIEKTIKVD